MICGILARPPAGASSLDPLLAALPGRPGDARETWRDGSVALGWRGDARPDGPPERQMPFVDRRAGLAVAAWARLDDRPALCGALDVPHPRRASTPDGALILRAYERWGRRCPDHLLGDYAFAVWDARRRTLFCARDHIGARPFYYALAADRVVFASDINAVLAAPGVSDELDESVVAACLTSRARPCGAHTFFRAIRKLRPGHALAIEDGSAHVERWWRPENAPAAPDGDDATLAEAFLEIYARAVHDRVRGPHPVGVHLSGGLDSSSIAVLAARALRRAGRPAPLAFGWHPPPGHGPRNASQAAEYGPIEAVSRQEGLEVVYRPPSAADIVDYLRRDATRDPEIMDHEEPLRRAAAARGVRVLLSGWGGDEGVSFNGRGYYPQLLRDGRLLTLWREARQRGRHPLAGVLVHAALPLALPGAAAGWRDLGHGRWRRRTFMHPAFARRARPLAGGLREPVGVRRFQLHLLQLGHLDARIDGWSAGGARHGIEYGYPLLDRRVLEFALGLPPGQFRRGRWSRWLMRNALASMLPPEVCWNPSKKDPIRLGALRDARTTALHAVRRMLEARPAAPARGRYVDMPRLLDCLRQDVDGDVPRRGPLVSTLRFLDF